MPAIRKRLQLNNNEDNKIAQKVEKRRCLNKRDNEKENGFDKYKNEIRCTKYILTCFISLFFFCKKS